MPVYKPQNSPFYYARFEVGEQRVHRSTKSKNKKEAELVERKWREQAIEDAKATRITGVVPMTFNLAAERYWLDVGQHHKNAETTFQDVARLVTLVGADTRMTDITDNLVATAIAARRLHTRHGKKTNKDGSPARTIAPATVNRSTTIPLKSICLYARDIIGIAMPKMPRWKKHMLKEPKERVRSLDASEATALSAAVRDDYALWFKFAVLTGLRRNETLIRWSDVNIFTKRITTIGKGNREVSTPITPAVVEILKQCQGQHEEFVFTYICQRPLGDQVRGERYPITPEGAKTQWRRLRTRSGVKEFRFHDLRHDMATRLLRQTGNLKIVQRALNHSDIKTTVKYAHVYDDELTAAMAQVQMPTTPPTTTESEAAKYA